MKKQETKEQKQTTTIKRGELITIRAKGRTFHAKAVKDFNPFHSMIYPVKDLDRGGGIYSPVLSGCRVNHAR